MSRWCYGPPHRKRVGKGEEIRVHRREQGHLQALHRGGRHSGQPGARRRDLRPVYRPPARRLGARAWSRGRKALPQGVALGLPRHTHRRRGPGRRRGQGGEPHNDSRHPPKSVQGHGAHRRGDRAQGSLHFPLLPEGKVVESWDSYDQLSLMRQSIEQELRVARSIQRASLPKEVPRLEGWQISPFYRPAREVGGDFYEFSELDDGRVSFAVGDATGKGVPAAFVMSATCALLGGVATASGASPGEVLARVNEALLARIPSNMFVTCFYAILEPESGRLVYANAGHNLPCRSRRHDGRVEELRARGMPLGLMPGMRYEEEEAVLVPGESVLLYSDGLIEAHDPKGRMFGTPRLRNLLTEYPPDAETLNALLLKELKRFTGEGREQEDDITLLTLRRSASLRSTSGNALKAKFGEDSFYEVR